MAKPVNGPAGAYRVTYPESVRAALRILGRKALEVGRADELADALREIDGRLRTEPVGFGEPSYRLRHLGLLKCLGSRPPLYVYYAVDEVRRIVYVMEFRPAPGGLAGGAPKPPDNGG
jgi:hypothetical protein